MSHELAVGLLLPFVGTAIASGAAAIFVGKTGKKKDDEE